MHFRTVLTSIIAFAGCASAQTKGRFCDTLTSICYQSYNDARGVSFRIALPTTAAAPFDAILQVVSPLEYKYVGFSWGGTMAYVPLTVGWPNGDNAMYSSRMAYGLILPNAYDKAAYTYLKGTGANSTHWTLTVRCKGCSTWSDVEGKLVTLDPKSNAVPFAHAYSTRAVSTPSSNMSTFVHHDGTDHWSLDLAAAQSSSFDQWVAQNALPDTPPPISSPPVSSRPPPSSTPSRSPGPSTSTPVSTNMPTACAGAPAPKFSSKLASGWRAVKVAGTLTNPRDLVVDTSGNLLVVENGKGIVAYGTDASGCVTSNKTLITQTNLNHGIALSPDGKTLYASSMTRVWSWAYDAATMSVSGSSKDLVMGMFAGGHTTRTVVIPPSHPNLLVVAHGSNDNFDYASIDMKVARAAIKVFDLTKVPTEGYNYTSSGYQMGYGLRNEVGLAFDANGMLWGVENGSDEVHRTVSGKVSDIHIDNPAEELNYFGDPTQQNTKWYGYPTCHTIFNPAGITDKTFVTGDQFVLEPNSTFSDEDCKRNSTPPRLTMQAHAVPLDAQFNQDNSALYVSFHGSSDRAPPTGYKVSQIPFTKGTDGSYAPKAPLTSMTGYEDIWGNVDESKCSMLDCFRPVGLAMNKLGRLYVTSDGAAEGELFMLGKI